MRNFWSFSTATNLVFGLDAARQLGRLCAERGWKRVFLVTDSNLSRSGALDLVVGSLRSEQVLSAVFEGGRPEPDLNIAVTAYSEASAFRPDAILGLGGGSNMDVAKMTAILQKHGGAPHDYFGADRVPGPTVPVIAVPTTAGTGSEVSHSAVLSDTAAGVKVSTLSRFLRPALAVVDPRLTLSCPPRATADSGIDALTHAIEAFTAVDFRELDAPPEEPFPYSGRNPMADVLAREAIRLIGIHLVRAVQEPQNLDAREGMSWAATLAGMAFSNAAVAVVHALEYPLGVALHVSHGAGNGLLLPYVMRYNLAKRPKEFAEIAGLLGRSVAGLDDGQAAKLAVSAVEELRSAIGIPDRLRHIGARPEQLPDFASKAFAIKRLMRLNPRFPTESELLEILRESF